MSKIRDMTKAYHPGNIVGTVAQASGTPTGAILEYTTNANGDCIRYADGTQICTMSCSFPANSNDNNGTLFTFPKPFASVKSISGSPGFSASATTGASYVVEASVASVTQCRVKVLIHAASAIQNPTSPSSVFVTVVGRWY
jgi:hypothetical protein